MNFANAGMPQYQYNTNPTFQNSGVTQGVQTGGISSRALPPMRAPAPAPLQAPAPTTAVMASPATQGASMGTPIPTPPPITNPTDLPYAQAQERLGLDAQNRQFDPFALGANPELEALIQMLQDRAAGTVASPAEMMLQNVLQQQQAQALGSARSAIGVAPGLAMRNAMNAQTQLGQGAAHEGAIQRAQESERATMQLSDLMGTMRGQDIDIGRMNLEGQLEQQQLNDQLTSDYMQRGYDAREAAILAGLDIERMKLEGQTNAADQQSQIGMAGLGAKFAPSDPLLIERLGPAVTSIASTYLGGGRSGGGSSSSTSGYTPSISRGSSLEGSFRR